MSEARRLVTAPGLHPGEKSSILLPRTGHARVAQLAEASDLSPDQSRFESEGVHEERTRRAPVGQLRLISTACRVRHPACALKQTELDGRVDRRSLITTLAAFESRQLHRAKWARRYGTSSTRRP